MTIARRSEPRGQAASCAEPLRSGPAHLSSVDRSRRVARTSTPAERPRGAHIWPIVIIGPIVVIRVIMPIPVVSVIVCAVPAVAVPPAPCLSSRLRPEQPEHHDGKRHDDLLHGIDPRQGYDRISELPVPSRPFRPSHYCAPGSASKRFLQCPPPG